MEYAIRLEDAPVDLGAIERRLLEIDPAAVVDLDAGSGLLRCSTVALEAELVLALAHAGCNVAPADVARLPSVCCGGCSG